MWLRFDVPSFAGDTGIVLGFVFVLVLVGGMRWRLIFMKVPGKEGGMDGYWSLEGLDG